MYCAPVRTHRAGTDNLCISFYAGYTSAKMIKKTLPWNREKNPGEMKEYWRFLTLCQFGDEQMSLFLLILARIGISLFLFLFGQLSSCFEFALV